MQFSNIATVFISALAAFKGIATAPITSPAPDDLPLRDVSNRSIPPALEKLMHQRYRECQIRMDENPRLFAGLPSTTREALCAKTAGKGAALTHALSLPPSELPVALHGLKGIDKGISPFPLPELNMAEYPDNKVLGMNLQDYKDSDSARYATNLASQVEVLRRHVPEDQRGNVSDARGASAAPACKAEWDAAMEQWARAEIADRLVLLNMRAVGRPQTIDTEDLQMDDLIERLNRMEFGKSPMKERMLNDALAALVQEHATTTA